LELRPDQILSRLNLGQSNPPRDSIFFDLTVSVLARESRRASFPFGYNLAMPSVTKNYLLVIVFTLPRFPVNGKVHNNSQFNPVNRNITVNSNSQGPAIGGGGERKRIQRIIIWMIQPESEICIFWRGCRLDVEPNICAGSMGE
jgi:hypothetical protein